MTGPVKRPTDPSDPSDELAGKCLVAAILATCLVVGLALLLDVLKALWF